MMWDEDKIEPIPYPVREPKQRKPVGLDEINDGRCKFSSWSGPKPAKPTYENHFGPGGFNRCIGSEGHVNPLHKDEWGNVFSRGSDGAFRLLRTEEPS